jgi:hypothetical protein
MVVGRVLLVPLGDEDWGGTLHEVAEHRVRSDIGWLLRLVACGLLANGAVILARRVQHAGYPIRAAVLSMVLSLGWAACAALCVAGVSMGVASARDDRQSMIDFQREMAASPGIMVIFALATVAGLAYVALAVMAARAHVITTASAVLLGLGGLLTLPSTPGPVTPLLIGSAGVLFAGHLLALRRTPNT